MTEGENLIKTDTVITDPAALKDLPPGVYTFAGAAADEVRRQSLMSTFRQIKHKPGNNGLGQCPHCGRPVHKVVVGYWQKHVPGRDPEIWHYRHNPIARVKPIPDRERTHCSKCGKAGEWYEFKPGSGECEACQT